MNVVTHRCVAHARHAATIVAASVAAWTVVGCGNTPARPQQDPAATARVRAAVARTLSRWPDQNGVASTRCANRHCRVTVTLTPLDPTDRDSPQWVGRLATAAAVNAAAQAGERTATVTVRATWVRVDGTSRTEPLLRYRCSVTQFRDGSAHPGLLDVDC